MLVNTNLPTSLLALPVLLHLLTNRTLPLSPPCPLMDSSASLLLLVFLLLLSSLPQLSVSASSSSDVRAGAVDDPGGRRHVHVLKPRPWPHRTRRARRETSRMHAGRSRSGAFSAMLPRGLVPPSDSSWRHNGSPESVRLFYAGKSTSPAPHP